MKGLDGRREEAAGRLATQDSFKVPCQDQEASRCGEVEGT
jgi:hypothetical protein